MNDVPASIGERQGKTCQSSLLVSHLGSSLWPQNSAGSSAQIKDSQKNPSPNTYKSTVCLQNVVYVCTTYFVLYHFCGGFFYSLVSYWRSNTALPQPFQVMPSAHLALVTAPGSSPVSSATGFLKNEILAVCFIPHSVALCSSRIMA